MGDMALATLTREAVSLPYEEQRELLNTLTISVQKIEESKVRYSESLAAFRAKHADFLSDAAETEGLDSVFDDVHDRNEPLRTTEREEW